MDQYASSRIDPERDQLRLHHLSWRIRYNLRADQAQQEMDAGGEMEALLSRHPPFQGKRGCG